MLEKNKTKLDFVEETLGRNMDVQVISGEASDKKEQLLDSGGKMTLIIKRERTCVLVFHR